VEIFLRYDAFIFQAINGLHNRVFDFIFLFLSLPVEYGAFWVILGLILFVFGGKKLKSYALMSLFAMVLADFFIGNLLSSFLFRQRPYLALPNVHQLGPAWTGTSFPSTHATISFAGAYILGNLNKKLLLFMLILASLIAISRIYLGMHYPLDVVAGAVIGILSAKLTLLLWKNFKVTTVE